MGAKESQKGTKRKPTGKRNPKITKERQKEPKGNHKEPKGVRREPKGSKRDPKGSQRVPKLAKWEPIKETNGSKGDHIGAPRVQNWSPKRSTKRKIEKVATHKITTSRKVVNHEK